MKYQGSCHCGKVKYEIEAARDICCPCLEGIELTELKRIPVDGRNF
jgi:hypothetical protein